MIIKELSVRHWRGLERAELGPLSPRLNLVMGPNESGKSRLVEALWFALFESTKGKAQHKRDVQSWTGSGAPSVRVVIEAGGQDYEIEKQYLKDELTRLTGGGQRLQDEEAEAYIHELLGSRPSKRTGADTADLGLWPLLWVKQGDSLQVASASLNTDTRGRLQEQLASEVGEVAAGPRGQRLLELARVEYSRYYTQTGREGKVLGDSAERLEHAKTALASATAQLEDIRNAADRLQKVREDRTGLAPRMQQQEAVLREASEKLDRAREAKSNLATVAEQVQRLKGELEQAETEERRRLELEQHLGERQTELSDARANLETLRGAETASRSSLADAQERVKKTEGHLEETRGVLERVQRAARREELDRTLRQLKAQLDKARGAKADLDRACSGLGAVEKVTKRAVKGLRNAVDREAKARITLEAAAARISVKALSDTELDGKPLAAGATHEEAVSVERTLRLGDMAEVTVSPGVGDVVKLRDAAADAAREVREMLSALGIASVPEAEAALERRESLDSDVRAGEKRLEDLAPEGLESLEAELAKREGELTALGATEGELPDLKSAEQAADGAETEVKTARRARDKAQEKLGTAHTARASEEVRVETLGAEAKRVSAVLAELPEAALLRERCEKARVAWQDKVAERSGAQRAFDELGGSAAELAVEQARAALKTLEGEGQRLRDEERELGWRIEQAQEESPYDTLQAAQAEHDLAMNEHERLHRHAAAAGLLWETLDANRQAAQKRLTGPVLDRIRPYLGVVFPGADAEFGDDLELVGRSVGGAPEAYGALSAGAKEQLNLLVRIGLADVLRGDDTLPLLLDDAMVNTDPERIRNLQLVLYQAARNLQVLLFTCHGQLYDSLAPDQSFRLPWREAVG